MHQVLFLVACSNFNLEMNHKPSKQDIIALFQDLSSENKDKLNKWSKGFEYEHHKLLEVIRKRKNREPVTGVCIGDIKGRIILVAIQYYNKGQLRIREKEFFQQILKNILVSLPRDNDEESCLKQCSAFSSVQKNELKKIEELTGCKFNDMKELFSDLLEPLELDSLIFDLLVGEIIKLLIFEGLDSVFDCEKVAEQVFKKLRLSFDGFKDFYPKLKQDWPDLANLIPSFEKLLQLLNSLENFVKEQLNVENMWQFLESGFSNPIKNKNFDILEYFYQKLQQNLPSEVWRDFIFKMFLCTFDSPDGLCFKFLWKKLIKDFSPKLYEFDYGCVYKLVLDSFKNEDIEKYDEYLMYKFCQAYITATSFSNCDHDFSYLESRFDSTIKRMLSDVLSYKIELSCDILDDDGMPLQSNQVYEYFIFQSSEVTKEVEDDIILNSDPTWVDELLKHIKENRGPMLGKNPSNSSLDYEELERLWSGLQKCLDDFKFIKEDCLDFLLSRYDYIDLIQDTRQATLQSIDAIFISLLDTKLKEISAKIKEIKSQIEAIFEPQIL